MRENASGIGTDEKIIGGVNGWVMLIILLAIVGFGVYLAVPPVGLPGFIGGVFLCAAALFCFNGMLTLEPNQAAVMIFFGSYAGTLRESGFFWVNPLYGKRRVSLRIDNWNTPVLKVNDERGNPIEIAAVIAWRVQDTAKAVFDVESCVNYLQVQSESAVRQVTSSHPYDLSPEQGGGAPRKMSLQHDLDAISR